MTAHTPPAPSARDRLLVVVDIPTKRMLLQQLLAKAGYEEVIAIEGPLTAVDLVNDGGPDLVVIDLEQVEEVIDALRVVQRGTQPTDYRPVLVVGGSADDVPRLLAAGASDTVDRRFRISEVLLRIRNLLETRHLHQDLLHRTALAEAGLAEADREHRSQREEHQAVARRVDAVLDGAGLTIAYQPIVDLRTNHVVGVEALARFSAAPVRPPDQWFADAWLVGRGVELELRAIELALAGLPGFPEVHFLSMNASPDALRSPALQSVLARADRARLVVELAEREPRIDSRPLHDAVAALRRAGIRLAVDDTGSGYASLDRIVRLQPDFIKLDRSLIEAVDVSPTKRALVTALKGFAYDTRSKLIAEGIETGAELRTLRDLGITLGQGFLLGRPEAR